MKNLALVTGGVRGIGAAITTTLLREGYAVIATYRDDDDNAKQFLQSETLGANLHVIKSDATSTSDRASLVEFVKTKTPFRLRALVNNVGSICRPASWEDISPESLAKAIQVNLGAALFLIQELGPWIAEQGGGSIVNVSSTCAESADPEIISYCLAKQGLNQATRAFARVLAPKVRINAVSPGSIRTRMTNLAGELYIEKVIQETPIGRLGDPAEVANVVSFLVSERASFITGQTLIVDGGHSLRPL